MSDLAASGHKTCPQTCPLECVRLCPAVLAEYTHPFEYLWLRRDNPSGLLELNQLIVAWMAFFGQDSWGDICVAGEGGRRLPSLGLRRRIEAGHRV